ncbi:N-acetylmuramic acid 6-phosphate etherase [Niallia nealsonii]|uniref:N-acetylmuramic acid 6-phosphate etherase n=1 Tax=Niallia nealsonii TaxID=115979 RepID=A0A2N0Z7X7_9BACI|nr:N-acetylmuramic acid 6-phosphate etherase [Niallia nealsonii]PKG25616.1 N-acetylmuramic acid 6-phosphate etherase [Niallia nealsonii]
MNKQNATEQTNQESVQLDEWSSLEIIQFMNQEDEKIAKTVNEALPIIAHAVDAIAERWKMGGRCFVVGAGTSGRLGMVDAVELGPTFSIEQDRWIGLVAGGKEAMLQSLEETEDDEKEIIAELKRYSFGESDIVIGVTASGSTPFVLAAVQYANELSALAIGISNNKDTALSAICDYGIEAATGAEVIRGSTRLKAGTSQKMILNMLSTATMVRLGKVYQNEMVDMKLINKKLVKRAVQALMNITDIPEQAALNALMENAFDLKSALFTVLTDGTTKDASYYLAQTNGHLKKAVQQYLKKGV